MIIELQHITKQYLNPDQSARTILNAINLSINNDDAIAITGPSGSGKSTLLNIMGTLDQPDTGTVKINGTRVNNLKDNELAIIRNRKIGFVFQLHHLLPQLSLLDNILLPAMAKIDKKSMKLAQERALGLLESVGLSERKNQLPGQLSVGECQRGALVRALINEPFVLLADEPTGSLDNESAQQVGELLLKMQKEMDIALVIVTHSLELAAKMKTHYKLMNGKLIAE